MQSNGISGITLTLKTLAKTAMQQARLAMALYSDSLNLIGSLDHIPRMHDLTFNAIYTHITICM